jgi:hypothetical protein
MHRLACSSRYQITHEYETVWLGRVDHDRIVISDFYGDPTVALIDAAEEWCAIGGSGLIVYFLEEPLEGFEYDRITKQFREFGREASGTWQIESIRQIGAFEVQVVLESGATHNVVFERTSP